MPTRGQLHQHFTCSFYVQLLRSQSPKANKDSQVKQLFVLSGSAGIKAARKHVDEIDTSILLILDTLNESFFVLVVPTFFCFKSDMELKLLHL